MGSPAVKVEGARELRASMKRAGSDLDDFADANAAVSDLVARRGASTAPRRSGRLAGSVRGNRSKTRAVVNAGGARIRYANAIHWGVGPRADLRGPHNITARPWLWKAAGDQRPVILELYMTKINAAVHKVRGAPA